MTMLEKAIAIAVKAHAGQKDKGGVPYILHPLRLMMKMKTETEQIAAVLHDVLEDTSIVLDDLRNQDFGEDVIAAVQCLTRKNKTEPYERHIERVKNHPIARTIKLADLEDNMDITRLPGISEKALSRLSRYHRAWQELKQSDA